MSYRDLMRRVRNFTPPEPPYPAMALVHVSAYIAKRRSAKGLNWEDRSAGRLPRGSPHRGRP
jgi:hypothetical protein